MAEITLNIYGAGKEKIKTLTASGYDLMMGTVEDFMQIIDVDKLNDNMEVAKMVLNGFSQLKPLLKDVFPEMTDEDFKGIKIKELTSTIMQIGTSVVESLRVLKNEKN